jgi:hypothetical protein
MTGFTELDTQLLFLMQNFQKPLLEKTHLVFKKAAQSTWVLPQGAYSLSA